MNHPPTKMSQGRTRSKAARLGSILLIPVLAAVTAGCSGPPEAATSAASSVQLVAGAKSPTILLVHGAFADGASWNAVSENLLARKYHVVAPAIGLRGLAEDSAYIANYMKQIDGCVLPVGHSYGAAVAFPAVFAGDLPRDRAAVLAAEQRPAADAAFSEPSGVPAWKSLPSWAVVASGDKAAGADVVRSMAQRAKAQITEIEGSHLIMVSQPAAVADVIATAANAVADKC